MTLSTDSLDLPWLGANARLTVRGADALGREVAPGALSWSAADSDVAVVDTVGSVTAVSPGATQVRVWSGAISAQARVVVQPVSIEVKACENGTPKLVVVEEPVLTRALAVPLARFASDLCAAGYTVVRKPSVFRTPAELRAYLVSLYAQGTTGLHGVILVGELPRAYPWVVLYMSNGTTEEEEAISFQYYADLDGSFSTSSGYHSPGGHPFSYDQHTGNVDWEIWIGVLPPSGGGRAATVSALTAYLARNHAYRAGGSSIPKRFMQITEHYSATTAAEHQQVLGWLTTGEYTWHPFSSSAGASFYFQSASAGLTVAQGLDQLAAGAADFTVHDAHGYWGASGQLTLDWVATHAPRTIVYWSNGCAVADLDHQPNVLTEILYARSGDVLIAKGTTNNSGGMGTNLNGFFGRNIATALTAGQSFGDAVLAHVNVPLAPGWASSREFQLATAVILGDPTLRLRP